MKKITIVVGRSSGSTLYDVLIGTLNKLTGVPWGYVKVKHTIKYLSSEVVPVAVAVPKHGKNCSGNASAIMITNCSYNSQYWDDITCCELRQKLMRSISDLPAEDRGKLDVVITTMKSWRPSDEFVEITTWAQEQNQKYPTAATDAQLRPLDGWLDACNEIRMHII